MNRNTGLLIAGVTLILAGCCAKPTLQEGWGEATQSYRQASVVNPEGKPVDVSTLDGMKADQVIDGYRAEKGEMANERIVTDVGGD